MRSGGSRRRIPPLKMLLYRLQSEGLPMPVAEHRFAPPRRWCFDLAYIDQKLAIEFEGGVWTRGRHIRGSGYVKDCQKYNAAVSLGWRVLRYTTNTIHNAVDDIREALKKEQE